MIPKRKKPKFGVGEVVLHKANGELYKICRVEFHYGKPVYYFHNRIWCEPERGLRRLTSKEIGPRGERGR